MVDVSDKSVTVRTAHARAVVKLPPEVRAAMSGDDIRSPKGPVFQTAIIAGTMSCRITIEPGTGGDAIIDCQAKVAHRTGVEMEALTGATVAALTVYDMCKALSHDIVIADVRLVGKRGGKSDYGDMAAAPTTDE